MAGTALGLLITAFFIGFRHGVDFDHIAAITDISGSQGDRRRALWLATLYALGHALIVFVIGSLAVLLGARLPAWVDSYMGPVVGITLLLMGGYVLYSAIRFGREMRLRSRWMLLSTGLRRLWRIIRREPERIVVIEHEHDHVHDGFHGHEHATVEVGGTSSVAVNTMTHAHVHRHVAALPDDPLTGYSSTGAFGVGLLHGVGAETPTQILLFLTAAGVGSKALGLFVLVAFLCGLVAANTGLALASAWGFGGGRKLPTLYVGVALLTAAFSLVLGTAYVLGRGDELFALF